MPPHNGEGVAGKPASRSRPAPARIVPAIPLSLSRGKPNKPKQNVAVATTTTAAPEDKKREEKEQMKKKEEAAKKAITAPLSVEVGHGHDGQSNGVDQVTVPSAGTPASLSSAALSVSGDLATVISGETAPSIEPLTNGQTDTHSPTVLSSPSTVRKPSDRFEMRQIRTELPPAFVPAEHFTPQSAASSQTRPQPQPYALPHGHPTNPSVGSIVFGGHDSSGSSPAPPASAGSGYLPPRNAQPYGHMHNGSESQGMRMAQGGEAFNHRQPGFAPSVPQQPYLEHSHAHFRYPPREGFVSGVVSPPNGFAPGSRSGSPLAPSGPDMQRQSADYQFAPGSEHLSNGGKHISHGSQASLTRNARPMPSQAPYHLPPPPPPFPFPELATSFENAESLRGYAFNHFNNRDLADCVLEIQEESGAVQLLEGHRIILSRSPVLSAIIRTNDVPTTAVPKPLVRLHLIGNQVRIHPVVQAIRYLYGGPLPPFDIYETGAPNGSFNVSVNERMDHALQHIATGSWLGIAAMAHRSVDMASSLLNWDTISSALEFALDGGISQMWPIDDGEEQNSTCSSDDSSIKPEAGGSPKYGHYASGLLQRVIEFTVQNIPPNYFLDSAAPSLPTVQRLPALPPKHESKSSRSDPRLSKIRFGEMSSDGGNHQRPSPTTTAVSSILLSLPFPLLRYLLEHFLLAERLGSETVASIMRMIIGEREVRRVKALQAHAANNYDDGSDNRLIQNLYWQESVEFSDQSRAGFRLSRKRVGLNTPSSSGAE